MFVKQIQGARLSHRLRHAVQVDSITTGGAEWLENHRYRSIRRSRAAGVDFFPGERVSQRQPASCGAVYLEHGADQGAAVRAMFAGWQHVETRRDLAGNERVTRAFVDTHGGVHRS